MRVVEDDPRLKPWVNKLLNAWPLLVDTDSVRTFAFSVGPWGVAREGRVSQFYNGALFCRFNWPLGVFVQLKWSKNRRTQFGFGWKLNGRITLTFRWQQTSEHAADGTLGPNVGQAQGWDRGTT